MVTDRDAQGMRMGKVRDLQECHGSPMDLLQATMDRFADAKTAQRIGLVTVFNLQTLSVSVHIRLGYIWQCFYGYLLSGSVKDAMDATRISNMGLMHNKDING